LPPLRDASLRAARGGTGLPAAGGALIATRVANGRRKAARPEPAERPGRPHGHRGSVSFPELVWAHFLWQREVHDEGILHGEREQDFQRLLAGFERRHGQVQNAYWCSREASAVAITARRPYGVLGRILRLHPVVRLHAVTHWVTRDLPELAALLHRCEAMSVKFTELLRHGSQQIAMEWVLAIAGNLLGLADKPTPPTEAETNRIVASTRKELGELQVYYERAGDAAGRIVYFWGMMLGIAVLGAIAAAGAVLLEAIGELDWRNPTIRNLYASYAMGAVGAVVSVLSRMASGKKARFSVDFEVGRMPIRRVASFRPFLGAVFALVLYFALLGDLVQLGAENEDTEPLEYYAVLSFFAGFSERWARGVLSPVAQLAGGEEETTAPATAPGEGRG
jgi:hypothetical protein